MKSVTSVFLLVTMLSLALPVPPASTLAPPAPAPQGGTLIVTSTTDSGPGTLRQALLNAQSGDTITFDPATFPPTAPVSITATSELPLIHQNNLTIDASNAGVILDGSQIGATPETLLLDDVSLTLDGGPNLVTNGDFSAGLGHWRPSPWDEGPGMTRGLNSSDFHSSPQSYQWSSVARAGDGRTVYDTTNTSDPFVSDPYPPGSTVWITAAGGSTAEVRLWYRHEPVRVSLLALFQDGHVEQLRDWWFERRGGWTEAVGTQLLPPNAVDVALEFGYGHSERGTNGLSITSNGNTIRGLQIIGFPNAGVALYGGVQNNVIGGDRGVGSGPVGQGNLISGNASFGVGLWDAGTSFNTIQGNIIGTDLSGTTEWGGRRDGIQINGANDNLVMDNLIGGYATGVYVCCVNDGSNTVRGNYIGTDANGGTGVGNRSGGVAIDRSGHNVIGPGNIVAHNGGPGIAVYSPDSLGNSITQNSIHNNAGLGIDLWDGGNTELAAPLILSFDLDAGTLSGNACANCTIEVFSDNGDEGAIYEGQALADGVGAYTFNKGASFTSPHLTATGTDAGGNTSQFSLPTSGAGQEWTIQAGNDRPLAPLYAQCSSELMDNHLGTFWGYVQNVEGWGDAGCAPQGIRGFKMVKLAFNEVEDWPVIDWSRPELSIQPEQDAFVTNLAESGITVTYILNFWDKANHPNGWPEIPSRFTTEEEIQRYLEYVRFIVGHFKDRVRYFELWNEPDNAGSAIQHIKPQDYVELVRRVAPVIHDEYPEAKIVVGSVSYLLGPYAYDHLYHLIQSDVMPLVDVVAWHPMYGTSPDYEAEREYYYAYPGIVKDIKETAIAHGFQGEFRGDEIGWCSPDLGDCGAASHMQTNAIAAKYHSRGIAMHLGMGLVVHMGGVSDRRQETSAVVSNLATVFAGAWAESFPVQVQTTVTDVVSYTFALPNDAHLLAIWNDAPAVEDDPGTNTTLILPGFAGQVAIGIDPLHSLVQSLITHDDGQALVIQDVRVKDYALLVRLAPRQRVCLPIIRR